jgi:hypothetical protein
LIRAAIAGAGTSWSMPNLANLEIKNNLFIYLVTLLISPEWPRLPSDPGYFPARKA